MAKKDGVGDLFGPEAKELPTHDCVLKDSYLDYSLNCRQVLER